MKSLTTPTAARSLGRYINWLFRYLFNEITRNPGSVLENVLGQAIYDFTPRFLYWFDPSRCPSEQRIAVCRSLAEMRVLPESIVERLQNDSEQQVRQIGNQLKARQQDKAISQILRVESFGQPVLFSQGEVLPESNWKTRKIKYLFFRLASSWGKSVSEESLIETFWPKDQTRHKKNLYWATSNLRALLKKLSPETDTPLIREHDSLALNPELPRWHDLEEFERASQLGLKLAKTSDTDGALEYLRLASQVYTGPYLDGSYFEFALESQRETEETALEVNLKACEIFLEKNLDQDALEHGINATELAPFRQDARALCMRAQIRLGQSAQAIDQFQLISKILKDEYELEPSTELLELFHRARLGYTDA